MLTFDLEQSLPTPVLTTNVVYYKHQLWKYNLGIHDCATEQAFMHMWHEGVASRGSAEVGSCILKHLQQMTASAQSLILYSDLCGGQNRNINITCLLLHIVANPAYPFTTIHHKFMVKGHSYLPNDRDFGGVEAARRKRCNIFVPSDWQELVRTARSTNRFVVRDMNREDFVSLQVLKKSIVNRKINIHNLKVEWLKIRWICVDHNEPLRFKYWYSHNTLEAWKTVDLKRKGKGRPPNMGRVELLPLYTRPRAIKVAKMNDLLQLLDYVPPVHHAFYRGLTSTQEDTGNSEESDLDAE